ncbi:uncharacterized protein TRIREDRAFT_109432 [Trichoderma reesei QM6a]|uniref:Predicted protein n=1 Tax=Hypocrea jecorina (strain QM6a) TaxID=431241 RepID=G0RPV9_HYPJQ|nr:uncharacterized protein TRIREDRAFT_109432 [Trichoderma reesei QM6a]EGR46707.1 predicted protein [Trichoderma reesei QM6a]
MDAVLRMSRSTIGFHADWSAGCLDSASSGRDKRSARRDDPDPNSAPGHDHFGAGNGCPDYGATDHDRAGCHHSTGYHCHSDLGSIDYGRSPLGHHERRRVFRNISACHHHVGRLFHLCRLYHIYSDG